MNNAHAEDTLNPIADRAAQSADGAIRSTQRVTNQALNGLAAKVQDLRQQAGPLLNRAAEQTNALAQCGANAVRESSQLLRERAQRASDGTVSYVRDEPMKALLIAAVAGAGLMALIALLNRPRD